MIELILLVLLFMKKKKLPDEWFAPVEQLYVIPIGLQTSDVESSVMAHKDIIMLYGQRYGIEAAVIASIIDTESEGDASQVTVHEGKRYYGLMQISYNTARWRGFLGDPDGLLNPDYNVRWGSNYLWYWTDRRKGNLVDGIAAYNAGSVKYNRSGYYINQSYVNNVLSKLERYRTLFIMAYPGYMRIFPKLIKKPEEA